MVLAPDDKITFGKKHRGETYANVWKSDRQYIEWLARESFMGDVRAVAGSFGHLLQTDEPTLNESDVSVSDVDISSIDVSKLYAHQVDGVKFIEGTGGRCILADEMGLGKTVQVIQYMNLHPSQKTVVVCPASLKLNWEHELNVWLDRDRSIQVLSGRKNKAITGDIIIVNYDILNAHKDALQSCGASLVVADESHYAKNQKSQRTKALAGLCKNIDHTILLSGTPFKSRPIELFTQLNCVDPATWNDFFGFAKKYCAARKITMGGVNKPKRSFWDFSGASNLSALAHELKPIRLRRTKEQVMDLPAKMSQVVYLSCDRKEYNRVERASAVDNPLMHNTELIMASMRAKIKPTIEYIGNILEQADKLIVFCTHNDMIDALAEKYTGISVLFRGGMDARAKDDAVSRFQIDPECKLFLGNVQAAGVGITLTAASHVVFAETPWSPADVDQAADRAHRIGQTEVVNVYHLCVPDTIDEHIVETVAAKREVFNAAMCV